MKTKKPNRLHIEFHFANNILNLLFRTLSHIDDGFTKDRIIVDLKKIQTEYKQQLNRGKQ